MGWVAVVQLTITPLLVWKIGIAGYGLVAFYTALVATLAILDLGMAPTLTRKLATSGTFPDAVVLRTFESIYAAVALAGGGVIAALAPFLATHWLNSSSIGGAQLEDAIRLMGFLFAARWMQGPYVAALQGLQRQVLLGVANAILFTLVNGIAVASLWIVGPEVSTFFLFLAGGTALQLLVLRTLAWRAAPSLRQRARFNRRVLTDAWGFSVGILGISVAATVLTQTDKLILSRLLSLEHYGVYAVAQALAAGLSAAILPIFNAIYPRLCELAGSASGSRLAVFYRDGNNLMSAFVVPGALMLALFPEPLLVSWTANLPLSHEAAPALALLALGTAMNGLMYPSYGLQLARGQTALAFRMALLLCVLVVPATFVLASSYGITGGASAWVLVNAIYVIVGVPWTFRACLDSKGWPVFYRDLLVHQGPALLLALAAFAWLPLSTQRGYLVMELACLALALLLTSLAFTPVLRRALASSSRELRVVSP